MRAGVFFKKNEYALRFCL